MNALVVLNFMIIFIIMRTVTFMSRMISMAVAAVSSMPAMSSLFSRILTRLLQFNIFHWPLIILTCYMDMVVIILIFIYQLLMRWVLPLVPMTMLVISATCCTFLSKMRVASWGAV